MEIKKTTENGFTLIEMLVCIIIIAIGVVAVFSVTSKYSAQTIDERNMLVASYLAQEGVEIIKNIRDNDWTANATHWNSVPGNESETLAQLCAAGCEVDWTSNRGNNFDTLTQWSDGRFLKIDNSTGFYQYTPGSSGGQQTLFKRKILIAQDAIGDDGMDIEVDVFWEDHQVTLKENIYNWKPNE